jgi:hypothetical protein
LDPASSIAANEIIKAARIFTKQDDGLQHPWFGRVWLNPPYSQPLIARFVGKMVAEYRAGHVTAAIMLTHNYTDTAWFHEAASVAGAICFSLGRLPFYRLSGTVAKPVQGQAAFYFGSDVALFAEVFSEVGLILTRFGES